MPDEPAPRRLSAQDQELQDELTEWKRVLEVALNDPEIQAVIGSIGFDAAGIDPILALVAAAQTRYEDRAKAMADEDKAVKARVDGFEAVQSDHSVFRQIARARFRDDPEALVALDLEGEMPDALDPFVTRARASYTNAGQPPYLAPLTQRGYDAARLTDLLKGLNDLVTAVGAAETAENKAIEATAKRNKAAGAARKEYGIFRDTVRPLLGPFLAGRLGF